MHRITAILTIGLVCLLAGSCSQGEKKISLRFRYTPGMKLSYEQLSKRNGKVMERDSVVKLDTMSYHVAISQEVLRFIDDSTAEILEHDEFKFVRPSSKDSVGKPDTVSENQEVTLQMLANGKIVNFKFADNSNLSQISYIKNYYEQGLPIFPSGERAPGYNWTQTTKVVLPDESMEASTTFMIKSLVREGGYDCALIEYEGNMLIPVEPDPSDSTKRSGVDRIKTTGVLYFAYTEGFVVEQKENWKIDGDRTQLKGGKMVAYKIMTDYDVDYRLVKVEGL